MSMDKTPQEGPGDTYLQWLEEKWIVMHYVDSPIRVVFAPPIVVVDAREDPPGWVKIKEHVRRLDDASPQNSPGAKEGG